MDALEGRDDDAGRPDAGGMGRGDDAGLAEDAYLIRVAGATLFGTPVADNMARAMNINRRTVQRWLNGQNAVPSHMWQQLVDVVRQRLGPLQASERDLARRANDIR